MIKLGELVMMILDLHRQGLSVSAIARRLGIDRKAFAEKPSLKPLPASPYGALLKLERRVSHEGMVSVGGKPRRPRRA